MSDKYAGLHELGEVLRIAVQGMQCEFGLAAVKRNGAWATLILGPDGEIDPEHLYRNLESLQDKIEDIKKHMESDSLDVSGKDTMFIKGADGEFSPIPRDNEKGES